MFYTVQADVSVAHAGGQQEDHCIPSHSQGNLEAGRAGYGRQEDVEVSVVYSHCRPVSCCSGAS